MTAAQGVPANGTSPVTRNRLLGVWHLVSYVDLDENGTRSEGPLGAAPEGVLIYTADSHMSVSMMRTGPAPDRTSPAAAGRQTETFMGYAGTWRQVGAEVRHAVRVSAHPHMVGTELIREPAFDGELLHLHGTSIINGTPQRRLLIWRRA